MFGGGIPGMNLAGAAGGGQIDLSNLLGGLGGLLGA